MNLHGDRHRTTRRIATVLCTVGCVGLLANLTAACGRSIENGESDSELSVPNDTRDASPFDITGTPADVDIDIVVRGLDEPTAVAPIGSHGLGVVAERQKGIRVVDLASGHTGEELLVDVRKRVVDPEREQGVLGVAVDAAATTLVVASTRATDRRGDADALVIEQHRLSNIERSVDDVRVGPARHIIEIEQPQANHNGGHVAFGPDGALWIGTGDGGGSGDPDDNAQRLDSLLGKLLRVRIRPDRTGYDIPADNPFVGTDDAKPEIWAFGLRNPWRFSFDKSTGDLWIGDVGQNELEEVNVLRASADLEPGANLGWSAYEATAAFDERRADRVDRSHLLEPVLEFPHDDGFCSVIGGVVYRGTTIPPLVGRYVVGDYCDDRLWNTPSTIDGSTAPLSPGDAGLEVLGSEFDELVMIAEDGRGELLFVSLADGTIGRLRKAA